MDLNCPHFSQCSGCELSQNLEFPPLWADAERFFEKELGQKPEFEIGQIHHWRTRAKLPVRGEAFKPIVGLFKKGSHEVAPIPHCKVHHPLINYAAKRLEETLMTTGLAPYDERSGKGILRYVQFVVERSSQTVQIALVLNLPKNRFSEVEPFCELLWKNFNGKAHSIWLNSQIKKTNTIFSTWWAHFKGHSSLVEQHAGISMAYHPGSFGQANLEMYDKLLLDIKRWILPNKKVLELYAGTGTIGFAIKELSKEVVLGEINPASKEGFDSAFEKNQMIAQNVPIEWHCGSAETMLQLLSNQEVLIVDPPRKGIEQELLDSLNSDLGKNIEQLIYVSCNFHSFQTQAEQLLKREWKLTHAKGYLFFPGTAHIETLAIFQRISSS